MSNKPKILVIGESGVDEFIYGKCERLCPEAPVPVFQEIKKETNLSMAGNVFKNLESFLGEYYKIDLISNKEPIYKIRYVDEMSGQMIVRVDKNDKVDETNALDIYDIKDIKDYSAVVISSYNKGFLTENHINHIACLCQMHFIPLFVDCKFILGDWSKPVMFVKINEKEYNENLKYSARPQQFCENLIVTRGSNGSELIKTKQLISAPKVEVANVSGAGDTYLAALVTAYLENGNNIIRAMESANYAAAYKVTQRGIKTFKLGDINL